MGGSSKRPSADISGGVRDVEAKLRELAAKAEAEGLYGAHRSLLLALNVVKNVKDSLEGGP
jgi:DNA-binding LytR/AlgR family response regulator